MEFRNEPPAGRVAVIRRAKAVLTFQEIDGDCSLAVANGAWLGRNALNVSFSVGHSEKLIVAVQLNETGGWSMTYEGHHQPDNSGSSLLGSKFVPVKRKLKGAAYLVKVQIINHINVKQSGVESTGEGELLGEYSLRLYT